MIPAHLPVDDVMERWPATIRVFLDLRMRCVGCPIARFHTVADAARLHGIECDRLLAALRGACTSDEDRQKSFQWEDKRLFVPSPLAGEGQGGG